MIFSAKSGQSGLKTAKIPINWQSFSISWYPLIFRESIDLFEFEFFVFSEILGILSAIQIV